MFMGFPGGSDGEEFACNAGDPGSIPGSRWSPGGGHGNPLQYYCLENSMDRGAWRAIVYWVPKSQTLNDYHFHFSCLLSYLIQQLHRQIVLLSPLNRWESKSSKSFSEFPKATQSGNGRSKIWTRICEPLEFLSLTVRIIKLQEGRSWGWREPVSMYCTILHVFVSVHSCMRL